MEYISKLKKQLNDYIDYIDTNITNQEEKTAVKQKTAELFLDISDVIQNILAQNELKLLELTKSQKTIDTKIGKIEKMFQGIQKDIYGEDEYDFEVVCPYCNAEFTVDSNENNTEIQCPECKNTIELDWNTEDECSGNCSHCKGCSNENKEDEEEN